MYLGLLGEINPHLHRISTRGLRRLEDKALFTKVNPIAHFCVVHGAQSAVKYILSTIRTASPGDIHRRLRSQFRLHMLLFRVLHLHRDDLPPQLISIVNLGLRSRLLQFKKNLIFEFQLLLCAMRRKSPPSVKRKILLRKAKRRAEFRILMQRCGLDLRNYPQSRFPHMSSSNQKLNHQVFRATILRRRTRRRTEMRSHLYRAVDPVFLYFLLQPGHAEGPVLTTEILLGLETLRHVEDPDHLVIMGLQ